MHTFDEVVASRGVKFETVGLVPIRHFTDLMDLKKKKIKEFPNFIIMMID
jgi:hypothetical protein